MTTLTFTTLGWQNWTVPSDCRGIDWCWSVGPGFAGDAGANATPPPFANAGAGGRGGSSGAASLKYSIAVSPGEALQVYVGGQSSATYAGLYSATRGWLCLAYGAQNSSTPGAASSCVGDTKTSGIAGDNGSNPPNASLGGTGGNGGSPVGPFGGSGGVGGNGARGGTSYYPNDPGSPAGDGGAGSGYGSAGGGGGGGANPYNNGGGASGVGGQGIVQLSYTPYVAHPPTVTALDKTVGSPGGGQTVVITGTNFNYSVSAVKFGDINAASFVVNSATQITAVTPQHTAGVFDVRVTNVDGTSPANSGDLFTFKARNPFFKPRWGF